MTSGSHAITLTDRDGGVWQATYDCTDWGIVVFTSGRKTLRAVGGKGVLQRDPELALIVLEEVRARG